MPVLFLVASVKGDSHRLSPARRTLPNRTCNSRIQSDRDRISPLESNSELSKTTDFHVALP